MVNKMKKVFLINLVNLFFVLSGCSSDLKTIEDKLTNLTTSTDVASEKINAENFNEYAGDNKVGYSLEVKNNGGTVDIHNLQDNINEPLDVIISIENGELQSSWKPLDNKNIYILMRE